MQAPKASTWLRHETAGAGSAHWRPRSLEIPWHWLASSNKRGDARTLGRPESPPASCPAAPSASIGVACLSLPTAVSLITKTLASMYGFPTRLCTVTCQTRPPQPGPDSTNRQPVRAHVQPTGRASHACDSLPANNPLRIHPPGPPPAPPTPPPPRTRGFTPGSAARGRTTPRPAGSAAAATAACAPGPSARAPPTAAATLHPVVQIQLMMAMVTSHSSSSSSSSTTATYGRKYNVPRRFSRGGLGTRP